MSVSKSYVCLCSGADSHVEKKKKKKKKEDDSMEVKTEDGDSSVADGKLQL